jgi:hypothetical protein
VQLLHHYPVDTKDLFTAQIGHLDEIGWHYRSTSVIKYEQAITYEVSASISSVFVHLGRQVQISGKKELGSTESILLK